jgi:hypothetical protein
MPEGRVERLFRSEHGISRAGGTVRLLGEAVIRGFDPACLAAFERLLAQPDPPEMPRRAHARPYGGDPERRTTRLPVILMSWLQRRHLEVDREEVPLHARRAPQRQRAQPASAPAAMAGGMAVAAGVRRLIAGVPKPA